MRAILYERFGERPEIVEVPDPGPARDGVVVRVEATGVCRSDWHGWQGHDPDVVLPHVPGHELAGSVVAVGADVGRWQIGDRVTVPFVGGCGRCEMCRRGDHQVCPDQFQPGFTHWGSFADFVAIGYADTNLVAIDDMAASTAAVLGCRFATAFRAVVDRATLQSGEWLAVHGGGGVGLSAAMIGLARGAQVVVIDVAGEPLERAAAMGVTATIRAPDVDDVVATVRDLTDGGAHVSIDAYGSAVTSRASIECLRRRGRHVQVGLMTGDDASAAIPHARVISHELDLFGSHGMAAHRYPAMLEMIGDGRLDVGALIAGVVTLDEGIDVLVDPTRTNGGITVIEPWRV